MKAFLWVVLLGILAVSFYFIFMSMAPDESKQMALMFGNSTDDEVEIHVELTMSMAGMDVFPYMTVEGSTDWKAWAKDHYVVTDKAGNQIEFSKNMNSNLQPKKDKMRGYHDSFLIGKLQKGTEYSFKYIPVVGEPEEFLYEFTSPADAAGEGRTRVSFQPI